MYSPETAQCGLMCIQSMRMCIHILDYLVMVCSHLPRVVLSGLRVHVSVVGGVQVRNEASVL